MKKEVKLLRQKAIQSVILSIEIFNRPSDGGRIDGVLIFLDHAFEMLLKSIILQRGGEFESAVQNKRLALISQCAVGCPTRQLSF